MNEAEKLASFANYQTKKCANQQFTLSDLSGSAKEKFNLVNTPHRSTILRVLRNNRIEKKRGRRTKSNELEESLITWTWRMLDNRMFVSDEMIVAKANQILSKINSNNANAELQLNFSNGWLYKFKKRNGFKRYHCHGESGDLNVKNIINDLPHVIDEPRNYALNDIWNADEFGIFYKMSPESTVGPGRIPGKKKKKERLPYLACANADGSEKYPGLIIGQSKKPKCFGKYEGSELGFKYYSNKKAWMNSDLFFSWLKSFDDYIGTTKDRYVVLLIDQASCHGSKETLPNLQHVKVVFLPANTTPFQQPVDAGVIACVKRRCLRRQMLSALNSDDPNDRLL